jgi:hypothetical protein
MSFGDVHTTGFFVALMLPVIAMDVLIIAIGVPRAIGDLRRSEVDGPTRLQPAIALALLVVAAAAVGVALWLYAHRHVGGLSI